MAKAVTKTKSQGLIVPEDIDIWADAGAGNENITKDDVLIPRLKIAQSMTKETKKSRGEYIEGLEEGDFYLKGTQDIFKGPIHIVPVHYERKYIEWIPLDDGGGMVDDSHTKSILDECDENFMLANGHEIVDTPEHIVIMVDEATGNYEAVVLAMTGSGHKINRAWNRMIMNFRATNPKNGQKSPVARWYNIYEMSTVPESNDKGDWFNWKVKIDSPTLSLPESGADVYRYANHLHNLAKSQGLRVQEDDQGGEAAKTTDAM